MRSRVLLVVVVVLAVVAVVGCASAPRLQVLRTDLRAEAAAPVPEGTCPATLRVRVVDGTGAPVPGAEVALHQRVSMNAPSMVPTRDDYHTAPVITDPHGEALVCRPERVGPSVADYFARGDGGRVEARLGERAGQLAPPFTGPLVLAP